ncbi:hypothetical protein [Rhizobium johnstonii]|uniref:hypothetical protein n=1 Tax=Rhizobium johnstonii TaxID=3019933 RepID=UPI003F9C7DFA
MTAFANGVLMRGLRPPLLLETPFAEESFFQNPPLSCPVGYQSLIAIIGAFAGVNVEFPGVLSKVIWEDPTDFAGALQLHLWRYGEPYWTLYRGIIGPDYLTHKNMLLSWIEGRKARMSRQSLAERNKKQKARQQKIRKAQKKGPLVARTSPAPPSTG